MSPVSARPETERAYCHDAFERLVATRGAATDEEGSPDDDHPVDEPANYSYDALDRRATKLAMTDEEELKATGYDHVGLTTRLTREAAEIGENGDSEDDERKSFDVSSSGEYLGITTADDPDADHEFKPYLLDVQGSVEGLEGNDGSVAIDDSYLYSPYGNLENVTGPGEKGLSETASDNPIRFQGFHYDSGIKTYDMHARNYRPGVARFLTEDRYQSAGADQNLVSDPLTQNRYAFLGGNPVSRVEFDGHIAWEYKHIRERRGRKAAERHLNRYYEVSRRSGGAGAAGAPTGGHSTAPLPMPEGVAEPPQHLDQTDLGLLGGIARAEASRMCRRDGRMECNRDRREELAGEIHAAQLFGPDTVHIEDAPAADAVQEKVAIRTSVLHTAVRAGQRSVSRSQKAKRRSARKLLADHGLSSSRVVSPSIEDVAGKIGYGFAPRGRGGFSEGFGGDGPGSRLGRINRFEAITDIVAGFGRGVEDGGARWGAPRVVGRLGTFHQFYRIHGETGKWEEAAARTAISAGGGAVGATVFRGACGVLGWTGPWQRTACTVGGFVIGSQAGG